MSNKLSLTKNHKDILKMAKEMLLPYGGTCWIEPSTKHHRLYIKINQLTRFTILAKTPCQINFAIQHKKNDLKKLIKEITNVNIS